jgi:hypothetical protein
LTDFALKANESKIYTATFTPILNSVTAGTISVASDKFSDAAGNINVDGADVNNSVVSKSVDTSLRVKVMVVLSPDLSLSESQQ